MLLDFLILLAGAVVTVPLFKRAGLGSVLGYLAVGVAVGPWGLNRFNKVEDLLHFAEIGVVLLLFVIGLELQPAKLWALRKPILKIGGVQVVVSAICISALTVSLVSTINIALVIGASLALSSTAFAIQLISERNELNTRWGRMAFAALLFQDLAVVPLLALIPVLGGAHENIELKNLLTAFVVILLILTVGRRALSLLLRIAAATNLRELLSATTLLTVLGMALLMEHSGLSMALGAFTAGVILSESEFRHELEADIEPFKGLLLGLFFMAVGMSLNLPILQESFLLIMTSSILLVSIKSIILFWIGKRNGLDNVTARKLGITLSQGGEFAFVLIGSSIATSLLPKAVGEIVIAIVTVSMILTPLLLFLESRVFGREANVPVYEDLSGASGSVLIAGFGRFGQIVARILAAKGIQFTALESNHSQVDFVRRYGSKVYFGDASRLDLLRAAGIEKATIFVLALEDVDASLRTAAAIKEQFPWVTIYARARNRKHAYQLMDLGVEFVFRETLGSALSLTEEALRGVGLGKREAKNAVEIFSKHDEQRLLEHRDSHNNEERMQDLAKEDAELLEELFSRDRQVD